MFEADDGMVFLAEGMTNGRLAEATATQLGYDLDPEPPFSGRKGRSRLAVIDGDGSGDQLETLVVAEIDEVLDVERGQGSSRSRQHAATHESLIGRGRPRRWACLDLAPTASPRGRCRAGRPPERRID